MRSTQIIDLLNSESLDDVSLGIGLLENNHELFNTDLFLSLNDKWVSCFNIGEQYLYYRKDRPSYSGYFINFKNFICCSKPLRK